MLHSLRHGLHPPLATRRARVIVAAKKGGGGKGGKGVGKTSAIANLLKKKEEAQLIESGQAVAGALATPAQYASPEVRELLFNLITSYYKATKSYLLEDVDLEQLPEVLYRAPFACLVHDRFQPGVTDPVFTYANRAALDCWDATWEDLIGMPSRKSAADEPATQQDRQQLLDAAATSTSGFITNYEGWRVSLKGKKFKVKGVTLFNIKDFSGAKVGQCAVFDTFELENGTSCKCQGEVPPASTQNLPPSQEEIEAWQRAADEQAAYIRQLKEGHGMANTDPAIQEAVAELKTRRATVEAMKQRLEDMLREAEAAFDDDG